MTIGNRQKLIAELFPRQPAFRMKQITKALFQPEIYGWNDISTLPESMRSELKEKIPFTSITPKEIIHDPVADTYKAIVKVDGNFEIETVLIKNIRGYWTICLSSQVGCAMKCAFCATGKMGLKKSLDVDEIIDQFRMWQKFLYEKPHMEQRISNLVYMGMGEPMSNYENVRESLNLILEQTEIGPTRITVSTVGVLPRLEQLLDDERWPHVRIAISLHSAVKEIRKEIVPSSYDDFLPKLSDWSKRYLRKFGNRRHHLTFEYVMLHGINDSEEDAQQLANYVNEIGKVRVNLIPYNETVSKFVTSSDRNLKDFQIVLKNHGVSFTTRKSKGDDIDAACGQLANRE